MTEEERLRQQQAEIEQKLRDLTIQKARAKQRTIDTMGLETITSLERKKQQLHQASVERTRQLAEEAAASQPEPFRPTLTPNQQRQVTRAKVDALFAAARKRKPTTTDVALAASQIIKVEQE